MKKRPPLKKKNKKEIDKEQICGYHQQGLGTREIQEKVEISIYKY